jgi:glutamate/tyrosine decarboxylase-like PLP-dependent enzyme
LEVVKVSENLQRIRDLEKEARRLEPTPDHRAKITDRVVRYAAEFLDRIHETPVFVADHNHGRGIYDSPISDGPIDIDKALQLIKTNVDGPSLNPASGGHVGYIAGGGLYPSALGDYLADVSNNFAGVYYVGPGAVRMEHMLMRWMAGLIGYPDTAAGDLTSGGSIANLVGIVTARDARGFKARDIEKTVVYLSDQVHHSLTKALRIAGLEECVLRHIEMDDRFRMRADSLQTTIGEDRKAGLNPWMVIASAGTTDTGAVDPLEPIGEVAAANGLWFHVDAAYGGFFALCDDGKEILGGIEKADSVVMDPHKGLFLPYGCGAVLVKDKTKLQAAHSYQANYMQDADEAEDEYSPADHSIELTRHFRGLRLWLPLKLFGVAPFRACLQEKLLLARHFYEEIQKLDGFEVGPSPDLSVVTYRYIPHKGDANEFNRRLVDEVRREGRVFITSTMIDGRFTLRLAVLCFRTHLETIEQALEVLREKAAYLESNL